MSNISEDRTQRKGQSRGQAAIEYIVTYGWAFVVIIAAVSVLAYFGLLNPSKYIPDSCEFGEQLKCVDQYIDDNGTIIIRFKNNFEEDIEIVDAIGEDISFYGTPGSPGNVTIDDSSVAQVKVITTRDIFEEDKERFDITFTFRRVGGSANHNISGTVFSEVVSSALNLI